MVKKTLKKSEKKKDVEGLERYKSNPDLFETSKL
jgi:hypothetical protein